MVDFPFTAGHADWEVECRGEAFSANAASSGGLFSLFDEPDALDSSLVCKGSSYVPASFSLELSSTVGDSTLRDLAVESRWADKGLDFDRCFLTCRPSP